MAGTMDFPILMTSSRRSRRESRRRRIRRAAFWAVSSLLVVWSFAAGVLWHRLKSKPAVSETVLAPVSQERRAEALRLMDEAVRARHEERWQDAMDAAAAARQADPGVKGSGILAAEVALRIGSLDALAEALRAASLAGENESAIKLLEAVDAWMRRSDLGVERSGLQAKQFLSEATDSERSSGSPYFFRGELERMLGEGQGAFRSLLAALYRQAPWQSAALLDVKRHLAAREAQTAGRAVAAGEPGKQARAALALLEAEQADAEQLSTARAGLVAYAPLLQFAALSEDMALRAKTGGQLRRDLPGHLEKMLPVGSAAD